jgi:hypothetical protein
VECPNSRPGVLICPHCEAGELRPYGIAVGCDLCGRLVEDGIVRTIGQINALADALGGHACECGHHEMRRLPDGVCHCPACGSEVIGPSNVADREQRMCLLDPHQKR